MRLPAQKKGKRKIKQHITPEQFDQLLAEIPEPYATMVYVAVLGLEFVNWRCLRTSYATWMFEAGANPKDVQGQLRHSRVSTTMDIYAQFVPESQRHAVEKMMNMVAEKRAAQPAARGLASTMIQ